MGRDFTYKQWSRAQFGQGIRRFRWSKCKRQ